MAEPILLKDCAPEDLEVDRERIGISYSGGGPGCIIELGVARAFVERGIIPDVITGVSAGALTGVAHAVDAKGGRGIEMGIEIFAKVKDAVFGLTPPQILWRALRSGFHLRSLGDNGPLKPLVADGLRQFFGIKSATIGLFQPPDFPRLMVGATNRVDGTALWFPDETPLEDALLASSAIPGVFPWREMMIAGQPTILVDGGVVANQPLSNLVVQGCGTIYACLVGYPHFHLARPRSLLSNAFGSLHIQQHQCISLEAEYAKTKLGDRGSIYTFRPNVKLPVDGYDFTGDQIRQVADEACQTTLEWLDRGRPDAGE